MTIVPLDLHLMRAATEAETKDVPSGHFYKCSTSAKLHQYLSSRYERHDQLVFYIGIVI